MKQPNIPILAVWDEVDRLHFTCHAKQHSLGLALMLAVKATIAVCADDKEKAMVMLKELFDASMQELEKHYAGCDDGNC